MNTKEFYNKAQNDIKNCLYCIKNGTMNVELSGDVLRVAKSLYKGLEEDFMGSTEQEKEEKKDTLYYVRDFLWAAERLDAAMSEIQDLESDFIVSEE